MQATQLCPTVSDLSTPMCEYAFKGNYATEQDEYMCCPHGATALQAVSCPPPS